MAHFFERRGLSLLLFTVGIVYLPSVLQNAFVTYDDSLLIYQNQNVLRFSWVSIWSIFTSYDPELYVPITLLTYQIEHLLFGLTPQAYHATSLLLHLGSISIVYAILRRILSFESVLAPLLGAAIFALHPIQVEAVAWAAARKDILSAFFALLSLWQYMRYLSDKNRSAYVLSSIFFVLGLGSKVSILLLPLSFLFLEPLFSYRRWFVRIRDISPFLGASLLFGIIALIGKTGQFGYLTTAEKGVLGIKSIAMSLRLFLWPLGFSVLHPHPYPFTLFGTDTLLSIACIVILIIFCAYAIYRTWHRVSFGIVFFILLLLPSFFSFLKGGFVYVAAERYVYAALLGLVLILALVVSRLFARLQKITIFIAGLMCAFLGVLTYIQLQTWKDSESLYRHILSVYPQSVHALGNLGSVLHEQGRVDDARMMYDQALDIDPFQPQIHANRGLFFIKTGSIPEGVQALRTGMESRPDYRPFIGSDLLPYLLLASHYDDTGNRSGAISVLQDAVDVGGNFYESHFNLGLKYQEARWIQDAYEQFRMAANIQPRNVDVQYHLAAVAAELGYIDEAINALRMVLWLHPDHNDARRHLIHLKGMHSE